MSVTTSTITGFQSLSGAQAETLSSVLGAVPLAVIVPGGTLQFSGEINLGGVVDVASPLAPGEGIWLTGPGATLDNQGLILNQGEIVTYETIPASNNPFIGAATFAYLQGGFAVSLSGGLLTNAAGGTIGGGMAAVYDSAAGTILNAGLIEGVTLPGAVVTETSWSSGANAYVTSQTTLAGLGNGIDLGGATGGVTIVNTGSITGAEGIASGWYWQTGTQIVDNRQGGVIAGVSYGVTLALGFSTVSNAGLIEGSIGVGVEVGTVENLAGGLITASATGVIETGLVSSAAFTLDNAGSIGAQVGVVLGLGTLDNQGEISGTASAVADYGGVVVNEAGGQIGGGVVLAQQYVTAGTLLNAGSIGGGVQMNGTTALYNQAGGLITGSIGVAAGQGATLSNAGSIAGSGLAVSLAAGDVLVVEAGAGFTGGVSAATTLVTSYAYSTGSVTNLQGGVLEFAAGTGSLDLGGSFTGFTTLQFDNGGSWTVTGDVAELADGVTLAGLGAGDTLVFQDLFATSAVYVLGAGLELGPLTLDVGASLANASFVVSTQGPDTTLAVAPCFCAGTRLRTPRGEVNVEALAPGDEVETLHGGRQRIAWVGRRAYDGRFIAGQHLILPVTLRAGCLAPGVPARDLRVSPGHAIWVDGLLIPAWRLVNNVNITQAEAVDSVQYVHIELPRHELLLAENCPTESFYDDICRGQFQEWAGERPDPAPGLPRCESGFGLEAVRQRLAARAGAPAPRQVRGPLRGFIDLAAPEAVAGWAQDALAPETPLVLDVLREGVRIARLLANEYRPDLRAAGLGTGCHGFQAALPPAPGRLAIVRAVDGAPLPRSAGAACRDAA